MPQVIEQTLVPLAQIPADVERATGWRPGDRTVKDWLARNLLTRVKVGGRVFVRADELAELLKARG
jgi:hypothetical protein